MLDVQVIDRIEDAHRVTDVWSALHAGDRRATPFQSPEWLLPYWEELADRERPFLLVVREGARVVGIAPLTRIADGRIELLGGAVSDYLGLVAEPSLRTEVAFRILRALGDRADVSQTTLGPLEPGMLPTEEVERLSLTVRRAPKDVCPVLPIPVGTKDPGEIVPPAFWKRVSAARRRLARAGEVEVRIAGEAEIAAFVETLVRLHGRRWYARGQSGVLADAGVRAFHRSSAPRLQRKGLLWPLELRVDGQPIAVLHALIGPRRVLYYTSGFDPRFATFSPGTLAIAALLERAIASGMEEVDFLRGVEAYKYRWGARDRTTESVSLMRVAVPERDVASGDLRQRGNDERDDRRGSEVRR